MTPCNCQVRPHFFDIHPDDLDSFLAGFEQVTSLGGVKVTIGRVDEFHVYRCRSCVTLWIVDDETRGPMAVRIMHPSEIHSFDGRPYRRELMIASYGGLSDRRCVWRGCYNLAMQGGILFCVDHQYPQFAPDKPTAD
jgi:hypothetical protein